jgi:hypothetical protein
MTGIANIAAIFCFRLTRQKLPYIQTVANVGNYNVS